MKGKLAKSEKPEETKMKRKNTESSENVTTNKKFKKSADSTSTDSSKTKGKNFEKRTIKSQNLAPKQKKFQKTSNQKKSGIGGLPMVKGKFHGTENNSANSEKPDWLKYKKEAKELREKRKAKRLTNLYDVTIKCKQLTEKLRRSDCNAEERRKITDEIHQHLNGNYSKMVFTHDMSRVIQWQIKYCDPSQRKSIVEELKALIVSIVQSKYSKNCIKKALKYGDGEVRKTIVESFYGNVVKLISHKESSSIVELAYSSYATETQKQEMKQEFYGDLYKKSKDPSVKNLVDAYENSPGMKPATLTAVKSNLSRVLNKEFLSSLLIQTVLYEFLTNCSKEDLGELVVTLKDSIVELRRTKFGAKIAVLCIWNGSNKDRKVVMKNLKEHVKEVSMSEHGHVILLALFDCVDDTVLLKKLVLQEIQNNLTDIASNEYGKRVVLYLVARRDSHYFHPKDIEYLKSGDENSNSKKPADIREKELLEAIIEPFLKSITSETSKWLSTSSMAIVTLAILKAGQGNSLKLAFEAICEFLVESKAKIVENEAELDPIEHPGLHMTLKKLIQLKKTFGDGEDTFGDLLMKKLSTKHIKKWIEFNRGCFLIIALIENGTESNLEEFLEKLKNVRDVLKKKKTPGAKILLQKLE